MDVTQTDRPVAKSEAVSKAAAALIPTAPSNLHAELSRIAADIPVLAKGKGALVTDVDGNDYIDFFSVHRAMILGHADERVVVAINKTASKGLGSASVSQSAVRLAELITSRYPSINMVRLVDSPAAAFLEGTRLARACTGRDRLVVFEGSLHQALADLIAHRGDGATEEGAPPYNDIAAVEKLFRDHGPTIAAVIVEPVATGFALVKAGDGFLPALRTLCDAHGALLVYDETATAFRLPPGGGSGASEVGPDLTLLGLTLGGGLPLAAYGGRKSIMSHVTSGAGTVRIGPASGNSLAMAAGIATLQAIGEPGFYDDLDAKAARLEEGLSAAAAAAGVPAHSARAGSLTALFFTAEPVSNPASAKTCDIALFERYYRAMLDRGVLLPDLPLAPMFLSAAHTDEQIDHTIEAAHESLRLASSSE